MSDFDLVPGFRRKPITLLDPTVRVDLGRYPELEMKLSRLIKLRLPATSPAPSGGATLTFPEGDPEASDLMRGLRTALPGLEFDHGALIFFESSHEGSKIRLGISGGIWNARAVVIF